MYCSLIATYTWHFIGSFNGKVLLQQPIYVCMFFNMKIEVLQLKVFCVCLDKWNFGTMKYYTAAIVVYVYVC